MPLWWPFVLRCVIIDLHRLFQFDCRVLEEAAIRRLAEHTALSGGVQPAASKHQLICSAH